MNVTSFLLLGKERTRLALETVHEQCTYGDLESAAGSIAAYLRELGAKKGDRAVLISRNSPFWVAAYLGTLAAGLVCIPLPAGIAARELSYILRVSGAGIAFIESGLVLNNAELLRRLHLITDRGVTALPDVVSQRDFDAIRSYNDAGILRSPSARGDDLAALMFTSGSTGTPRGVMVSHTNILANTKSIIEYMALTEEDRVMAVLPFHYCFGASLLHTHLGVGATLVIDSRFMYPEVVLQRMIDTRCTGFAGVPSHFQLLLRGSSLREKSFPHLRYIQQAGGSLAPAFIRELRQALPHVQTFVMYGQTEATARLSYLPPEFLDTKIGSIGKGMPGVNLQVLNELGQEVRPGEVGEIVAQGKNIAQGYWGTPRESGIAFRDGKLFTGDLATVDEDGFIYIVDRAKDILKCGGKRVSCREIEDGLLVYEEVLEAAVVGIPDDVLGEAPQAFLVLRGICCENGCGCAACTAARERIRLFCREHLPPQLVPREIVFVRSLPKNSAGKILKAGLKKSG